MRGIYVGSSVDSSHKGQWRGALPFSLICALRNGWANNRDPGDLRRHRAQYDINIIVWYIFSYLPTEKERQKQTEQWEANSFLVFNTHQVYWNVLHWAYLCSLTEKCIAPTDEVRCNFVSGSFKRYAYCHRYDQAMLNLLVSNWNQYQERKYTTKRYPLQWRHNDHDSVSNHQPHGCLLSRFIRAQIKENIKAPRHWPLCGEFTGPGDFPAQRASNAENVSVWWRHHGKYQDILDVIRNITHEYDLTFCD